MTARSVGVTIVVAFLVIGVVVVYSFQTSPAHTSTIISTTVLQQTITVTVSGSVTTTTVPERVEVASATGSQEVLCTATNILAPETEEEIVSMTTLTIGNSTSVSSSVSISIAPTYKTTAIYVSATNSTEAVGYVATTTSQDSGFSGPGAPFTIKTCTYLP
jgi:hypothetical protein